jgi:ATP-binding cassette subfamily B protein
MKSIEHKSTIKQTVAIFWRFTRVHKAFFWYATIGSVLATIVADILPPLVIAGAFNKLQNLYSHHQPISFADMSGYFYAYVAVSLASIAMWRTQAWAAWRYTILTEKAIMDHIFNHLQNMDSTFHANRFGGSLVSQSNKFVSAYDRFASDFNWNILTGITAFVSSLVVLFVTNFIYAVAFLVLAVMYVAVVSRRMKKQIPYNRVLSSAESQTTAKLADNITNVATVRSFAGEKLENRLFSKQTSETMNKNLDLMNVQLKNELISQGGTTIVQIAAFGIGILSIAVWHAPIGALYLTLTYTLNLSERLWNFMFILRNLNRSFGDANDMTAILNLEADVRDQAKPEQSRIHRGEVKFKDVVFAYPENADAALFSDLNLKIKPGEKVGLVGPSGGGKTTVTKLLLRFMDIQAGEITIDNQNIAAIKQRDLRSHIAYVPQEPLLFHRTLAENIAYADPAAEQKVIEGVAKMAHAHEFIGKLPQGYETLVGERGVKLSGGQRQRVAIARAMLKNAPILVLDEATSALDSESEVLIQDALWKLMENRTAIVIAHRLSTIQRMDRIIVMDEGRVVEEGSHKDLLRQKGVYAKLWAHQSGGFIEDDEDEVQ